MVEGCKTLIVEVFWRWLCWWSYCCCCCDDNTDNANFPEKNLQIIFRKLVKVCSKIIKTGTHYGCIKISILEKTVIGSIYSYHADFHYVLSFRTTTGTNYASCLFGMLSASITNTQRQWEVFKMLAPDCTLTFCLT